MSETYTVDLESLRPIPLERRTYPRHRAIRFASCSICSAHGLYLDLAPTVVSLGGRVCLCQTCAVEVFSVSADCFVRLIQEMERGAK